MPIDPDDLPLKKKHTEIVLGQDISAMSEFELSARIMEMEAEIVRLLGVRTDKPRRLIDSYYLCQAHTQHFRPNPASSAFDYFPLDALPPGVSASLRGMIVYFAAANLLPPVVARSLR